MPQSVELTEDDLERLLVPYISASTPVPANLYSQLAQYLQILMKWNARTNLTAIRDPEEIARRHFGESLFAAQNLGNCTTLLDFGSGAGFPGLPIQLLQPQIPVTLAESQNKKATFLREVIRTLGLKTAVWAGRVEAMPATQQFDIVTLRAVDNMDAAMAAASIRAARRMMLLTTTSQNLEAPAGFTVSQAIFLPGATEQSLLCLDRDAAPPA